MTTRVEKDIDGDGVENHGKRANSNEQDMVVRKVSVFELLAHKPLWNLPPPPTALPSKSKPLCARLSKAERRPHLGRDPSKRPSISSRRTLSTTEPSPAANPRGRRFLRSEKETPRCCPLFLFQNQELRGGVVSPYYSKGESRELPLSQTNSGEFVTTEAVSKNFQTAQATSGSTQIVETATWTPWTTIFSSIHPFSCLLTRQVDCGLHRENPMRQSIWYQSLDLVSEPRLVYPRRVVSFVVFCLCQVCCFVTSLLQMADPEVDHGFVYNAKGQVDILKSPFFNFTPNVDHSIEEYMDRIIFQLATTIDEQISTFQWTIISKVKKAPDGNSLPSVKSSTKISNSFSSGDENFPP
ncbi:hypothetical protein M5K25_009278 [Dendrobium thyrsiflorum]|uniref:Uncharacterized protein n=1 Tax=Dendrobium thyrsiflorum TaxID=117978 RepID=A0ABD0V5S7_DENTH